MNTITHLEAYIRWYDEFVIPGYERKLVKNRHPHKWQYALELSREYRAELANRLEALKNNPQNGGYNAEILINQQTGHLIPRRSENDPGVTPDQGQGIEP